MAALINWNRDIVSVEKRNNSNLNKACANMTEKSVGILWAKHWTVQGTWALTECHVRVSIGLQGHPILLLRGSCHWDESLKVGMAWSFSDHTTGIEGSEPRSGYIDTQGMQVQWGTWDSKTWRQEGGKLLNGYAWELPEIAWKTSREALGEEWTAHWAKPGPAALCWLGIIQTHSKVLGHLLVGGFPRHLFQASE